MATRSARDKVVGAGEAQEVLQAWAAQGAELHRLGPGLVRALAPRRHGLKYCFGESRFVSVNLCCAFLLPCLPQESILITHSSEYVFT